MPPKRDATILHASGNERESERWRHVTHTVCSGGGAPRHELASGAFRASSACAVVIVRDAGDAWQVVLQTDHADVSAACARQWADTGARHASLVDSRRAPRRRLGRLGAVADDGSRHGPAAQLPRRPGTGPPRVLPCRALQRSPTRTPMPACSCRCTAPVSTVSATERSPSSSSAGRARSRISSRRSWRSRKRRTRSAASEIGVTDEERWADYHRLQVYDRFSLFFCLKDLEAGESDDIGGYRLEPIGPGRVRMDPYPFLSETADFTLLRRILPKRRADDRRVQARAPGHSGGAAGDPGRAGLAALGAPAARARGHGAVR